MQRRVYLIPSTLMIGAIILSVFLNVLVSPTAAKATLPRAHMIANVPWHQQFNALACGDGVLETVFDYWGPDINQKEIANVARSSSTGTWTADLVRAGHFSYLSDAQGRFFPAVGPYGGFEERPLGYAAFSHTSTTFWLDELKALIAHDIPIIVLMNYTPTGGGGHYRVVIGYDDDKQLIYFLDPWGRDLNHLTDWTGMISWSYSDFQMAWNYSESETDKPYFGVAIMPWSVSPNIKGKATAGSTITVTARIEYTCPKPFDSTQFPAESAAAQIALPEGMVLVDSTSTVSLGTINAGSGAMVTWKVLCNGDATGKTISVTAWGIVSGSVPEACWRGQAVSYPPYDYTDAIGGKATAFALNP